MHPAEQQGANHWTQANRHVIRYMEIYTQQPDT